VSDDVTVVDAFKRADQVLYQAVKGISDLIVVHGLINLDFADVRTIMNEMGMALMGTGTSAGEGRALDAATKAISSPLLEDTSIKGATGILINVTGGPNMTLYEISEASKIVQEEAHEDANILFGAVIDENMKDEVRVTVIATGFNKPLSRVARPHAQPSSSQNLGLNIGTIGMTKSKEPMNSSAQQNTQQQNNYPTAATRHAPGGAQGNMFSGQQKIVNTDDFKDEAKEMARDIGVLEFQNDEYDIPTFLRKQAD